MRLLMLLMLLMLVLSGWSLPASAAQTYKIPIEIIPGSVTFEPIGDTTSAGQSIPTSFPTTQQVTGNAGACCSGSVAVVSEIVDGGIEIELSGFAGASGCYLGGAVEFDAQIVSPELGGTSTTTLLVPEVQSFNVQNYAGLTSSFEPLLTANNGSSVVLRGSSAGRRVSRPASGSDPALGARRPAPGASEIRRRRL
jgi:hypothetical protein